MIEVLVGVLNWFIFIMIIGIMLLVLAIIHYFKVCKDFIEKEGLEDYQDNEEWFN